MMKLRLPPKKITISLIVVIIVMGIGAYAVLSVNAWKAYETRLRSEQREYSQLQKDSLNGKTADARLNAIRKLDDKLMKRRADLCKIDAVYAWQANIVPQIRDGVAQCTNALARLNAVASPLHELRQYLDVGDSIRKAVGSLVSTEALTENNWTDKGLKPAEKALKDLKALEATGDAKILKNQAESLVSTVVAQWKTLINANTAKDKTAYANLSKTYTDFAALADSSDTTISTLVERLRLASETKS